MGDQKKRSFVFLPLILGGALFAGVFSCYYFDLFNCSTRPVPGPIRAFDPVGQLERVTAFAGKEAKLVSIKAVYVKSDGTLDLKAKYKPSVLYQFYRPIYEVREGNDLPLGAGGRKGDSLLSCEIVSVTVRKGYVYTTTVNGDSSTHRDPGMSRVSQKFDDNRFATEIVPPPGHFSEIWKMAMAKDAPRDAVAVITYDKDGYDFMIQGTVYHFKFK